MSWISVKERLPENEQKVLTCYYDISLEECQISLLEYYKKGTVMSYKTDRDFTKSTRERLFNMLYNKEFEIVAQEDGFYICEFDENGDTVYRKHADCITHWMPLPEPPQEEI